MKSHFVSVSIICIFLLLTACSGKNSNQPSTDIQTVDGLALTYIQASAEGDHNLYKKILAPDQPHYRILEVNRHVSEGAFNRLNERYSIYRYNDVPNEAGEIYYKIVYFNEKDGKNSSEYLRMIKENNEWKIYEIDEDEAKLKVANPEGAVTVHEYKEGAQ